MSRPDELIEFRITGKVHYRYAPNRVNSRDIIQGLIRDAESIECGLAPFEKIDANAPAAQHLTEAEWKLKGGRG